MELLETHGSKSELLRKSAEQKAALDDEVKLLSERTERILMNALIVGGALAVSYLFYRQFSSKSKKKKKKKQVMATMQPAVDKATDLDDEEDDEPSGLLAGVGGALASQALTLLLAIAKEKLMEYLKEQGKTTTNEHTENTGAA